MKRPVIILMSVIALVMIIGALPLIGCGTPLTSTETPPNTDISVSELTPTTKATPEPGSNGGKFTLTPNPVESANPQYGGIIRFGQSIPINFDGHQKIAYGPAVTLPTFNQLVMYNLDYKETVLENIVGDLADSWETSQDGTEITFKLHHGVNWHDGVPFTADDVIYSLNKMTDPSRSAISTSFPAYQSAEQLDDYTVRVYLKYPSAGFMVALASGDAVIQAKHLAGIDPQSVDFMVGTGPFIINDYKVRVHLKWQRNPNYWKKDKYGNQLPYIDGIIFYQTGNEGSNELLISRQLDLKNSVSGAATIDTYQYLKQGAPELLWQRRDRPDGGVMQLNLNHTPLNDIRVRHALALIIDENSLIIGYSGDPIFGITDIGILPRNFGLPKEDILKLMGWDKPYEERIAEAKQLMTDAGYPDGFKMTMISTGASTLSFGGANTVYADTLHKYLNIDCEVLALTTPQINQRLKDNNYDLYNDIMYIGEDPVKLTGYFGSNGSGNASHYTNPELDNMLSDLDRITDPDKRREAIWDIERLLLTDLPGLPTGTFIANIMPYYNWVKNIRWTYTSYSNNCRLEDVWIDKSIANQAGEDTISTSAETSTPTFTPTPLPTQTPDLTPIPTPIPTEISYDRPDIPIIWVSIDPPEAQAGSGATVTFNLIVPAGAYVYLIYILPVSGTRSTTSYAEGVAGADGKIELSFLIYQHVNAGEGTLELTVTKTDGTKVVVTRPYMNR